MGLSYDFERFMKRYPRTESDRRRLVPERAARNLLDLRATLEDPQGLNFVPAKVHCLGRDSGRSREQRAACLFV